jgi:hypothetical protein
MQGKVGRNAADIRQRGEAMLLLLLQGRISYECISYSIIHPAISAVRMTKAALGRLVERGRRAKAAGLARLIHRRKRREVRLFGRRVFRDFGAVVLCGSTPTVIVRAVTLVR